VLIMCACTQRATTPPPPTDSQPAAPTPRIIFPDGSAVRVEIAADPATREQGLMYRDRLADDDSMLFFFPEAGQYAFWMKNTLIPLDLLWIDDQHRIVHIAHDVPPCKADPCPNYPPGVNAKYVLELAAGVAARHHLADGNMLKFEGLDRVAVR
jgi:uncharacterized membrane protein (UPF0127 family)